MICHKHKLIFIHIPKTGGSSIEIAINPSVSLDESPQTLGTGNTSFRGKHWNIDKCQQEYKEYFDSYFKFTFVRNPWDREVSRWKWFAVALKMNVSFKKHLKNMNNYREWIYRNDKYPFDFIGRFENLQEDFNIICDKIGIPKQKLPHSNKTKRKHYAEYYNDETREIVAEKYAKDIEHFGYKFGE